MTSKQNFTPFEHPPSYEDAIRTDQNSGSTSSLQVATLTGCNFNTTYETPQPIRPENHVINVEPVADSGDPSGYIF